jgi:head-tail adaptor
MNTQGYIHPGQLNRKISLWRYTTTKTDTGESTQAEELIKDVVYAKREDHQGSEDDNDGRIIGLGVAAFTVRFTDDLFMNGQKYFVKDFDGIYQINSVELTGQQRNRFLKLKCTRRGH